MCGITALQLLHRVNQLLVNRKLHPEEGFLLVADDIKGYGGQEPEVSQIYMTGLVYRDMLYV